MEFHFEIIETASGGIVIEADNYDDAVAKATDIYHGGGVMWASPDYDLHLERSYE